MIGKCYAFAKPRSRAGTKKFHTTCRIWSAKQNNLMDESVSRVRCSRRACIMPIILRSNMQHAHFADAPCCMQPGPASGLRASLLQLWITVTIPQCSDTIFRQSIRDTLFRQSIRDTIFRQSIRHTQQPLEHVAPVRRPGAAVHTHYSPDRGYTSHRLLIPAHDYIHRTTCALLLSDKQR